MVAQVKSSLTLIKEYSIGIPVKSEWEIIKFHSSCVASKTCFSNSGLLFGQ
jgi:hypothetical protein